MGMRNGDDGNGDGDCLIVGAGGAACSADLDGDDDGHSDGHRAVTHGLESVSSTLHASIFLTFILFLIHLPTASSAIAFGLLHYANIALCCGIAIVVCC